MSHPTHRRAAGLHKCQENSTLVCSIFDHENAQKLPQFHEKPLKLERKETKKRVGRGKNSKCWLPSDRHLPPTLGSGQIGAKPTLAKSNCGQTKFPPPPARTATRSGRGQLRHIRFRPVFFDFSPILGFGIVVERRRRKKEQRKWSVLRERIAGWCATPFRK